MDLDSVELLEKMNATLKKLSTDLDQVNARLDKLDPKSKPFKGLEPEKPKKYTYLDDLMSRMRIYDYYGNVANSTKGMNDNCVFVRLLSLSGYKDKGSIEIYNSMTPLIDNIDGTIVVTMFYKYTVSSESIAATNAMMKQLIKCCHDKKFWDQLESRIVVTTFIQNGFGIFNK